ncbi:MAG TPA: hypothetical protein DCE42_00120 [Myxococcales bacterium]|nr:hypothetical protein [Deltaproteobacteria bacterium]MBU50823.1 hypothetical protein [Deltaproteobacteria bacterium]HAA53126.1 hypothetical protein [Myxococcales bacterium]
MILPPLDGKWVLPLYRAHTTYKQMLQMSTSHKRLFVFQACERPARCDKRRPTQKREWMGCFCDKDAPTIKVSAQPSWTWMTG